jgi:REP element-mobilizing transposase RayT
MDNHIHLLIKPAPGQSLSKIMQWIKGNFAKYWNNRYFLRVFNYIDKNPERAGVVEWAEAWEFGGLYHYLHGRMDVVDIPRTAILELFFLGKVVVG